MAYGYILHVNRSGACDRVFKSERPDVAGGTVDCVRHDMMLIASASSVVSTLRCSGDTIIAIIIDGSDVIAEVLL